MIWLVGIGVVLLAIITLTCMEISVRLGYILAGLNGLAANRAISNNVLKALESIDKHTQWIEMHTKTTAGPQYEIQYHRDRAGL